MNVGLLAQSRPGRNHERLDLCLNWHWLGRAPLQGKPGAERHAGRVQRRRRYCCVLSSDGKWMAVLAGHSERLSGRRRTRSVHRDRVHSLHDPQRGAGGQLPAAHDRDRVVYLRCGSVFLRACSYLLPGFGSDNVYIVLDAVVREHVIWLIAISILVTIALGEISIVAPRLG